MTILLSSLQRRLRDIRSARWWREHALMLAPWALILLLIVAATVTYSLSESFRFEIDHAFATVMTGDQELIRDYLVGFGVWAPVVSIVLMVAQVIVVGIPATIVLFANGVAFGTLGGATLNIVGRTLGAIIAFGLARLLGKGAVEKLVGRLTHADRFEGWMERWGGWAVFATRAIPGMPSDVFSYVAGFTNVSWRTYLVATFFGFLPQSILYAWLGSAATGWFWAVMLFGTVVSATIAASVISVQAVRRWRSRRAAMVV